MADAKIVLSAVDETKSAFDSVKSGLQGVQTSAVSVQGALYGAGIAAAALGFASSIKGAIDAADHLNKLAQRTGIATEALSQLQFAAKLADVSSDTLTTGIKKLNLSIAEGLGGDKAKVEIFKNLGVSLKDASGEAKTADKVLLEMAGSFSTAKDGATKTAYAVGLMGKAGDEMIPLLNGGTAAITEMMEKARKLGLTISTEFAKQAEEFNDNLTILKASGDKLAISLAGDLVASLGKAAKAMADAAVHGGKLAGILAGIQTFLTGDDRHKANVAMVDLSDKILATENSLLALQAGQGKTGNAFTAQKILQQKESLRVLREEYDMHKRMGVQLDAEAAKAEAKVPKQTKALKTLDKGGGAKAEASDYDRLNASIEKRLIIAQQQLAFGDKLPEYIKHESEALQDLWDSYTRGKLTLQQVIDLEAKVHDTAEAGYAIALRKSQEEDAMFIAKERQRLVAEGYAEAQKLAEKEIEQNHERLKSGKEMLEQLEFDTRLLTMNTDERERAIVSRELERQGIVAGTQAYDEYFASIMRATGEKAALQKSIENFKDVWESVDKTAHDVFVNIFQGGKNAFTKLRDTLKATLLDLLYQMTVKKWVFSATVGVTGTSAAVAQSALGTGGGAGGLMSNVSGASSLYSGASNVGSAFMAGYSGTGGAAAAGGSFASTVGGGLATDAMGATVIEATAAATIETGLGAGISAGLAAVPVVGWIALAALVLYMAFSGKGGGPKTEGGYAPGGMDLGGIDAGGSMQGSQRGNVAQARTISEAIGGSYSTLAGQLGLVNKKLDVGLFYAMDNAEGGTSDTQLQVTSAHYKRSDRVGGIENVARGEEELKKALAEETTRVLFAEIQAAEGLSESMKSLMAGTDAYTSSIDELTAVMTRVNKASSEKMTLEETLYQLTATDSEKLTRTRTREMAAIDSTNRALLLQVYGQQDLKAAMQASAAAIGNITAIMANVKNSVSSTIFDLQYGMGTNQEKYNMLDVKGKGLDDRLHSSTDINEISRLANDLIAVNTTAFGLLDATQQKATYLEFEKRLTDIDTFVTSRGADAISIQHARDTEMATTIAAAVKTAVDEGLTANAQRFTDAAAAITAAANRPTPPTQLNVNVTRTPGVEVAIDSPASY